MKSGGSAKVLFYVSKLIYPKYNPFWFVFYMYISYFTIRKRKFTYILQVKPHKQILDYINTHLHNFIDINNTVIVYTENVYRTDKILRLFCTKKNKYRIVRVLSSPLCKKELIACTETCYYNLQKYGFIAPFRLLSFNESMIKFADEIDVSLISCPYDISNAVVDAVLESYFKTPKLINKGDIFEINVTYFSNELFFLNKINQVESVFFKCNKIFLENCEVEGTYCCAIGETAIKQSANIQSFIPEKKTRSIYNEKCSNFEEIPLCPYGLQSSFERIVRATIPFLKTGILNLQPAFLLQGEKGSGKEILVSSLASQLGMHFCKINNFDLTASIYAQNETKIRNALFNAKMSAPCIISINNFENFGRNNEGNYDERLMDYFSGELNTLFENNAFPVILFACSNSKTIPADLQKLFLETFDIDAPNATERVENLKWILEEKGVEANIELSEIAKKTHGFFFEDLRALAYYAQMNANQSQYDKECLVTKENFDLAIDYMQENHNESIGAPKVPKVQWADIGGLNDVKEEIIKTINLPLKHPELVKSSGLRRSGILLFGPPGTGKTLLAKAVATECSLCFLSVKGPELLNMYVGQSEQNVRDVFERARQASPCIIFFDELDSLAPNRGMSGDSGGVMDRVVSQLLAEMDGLNDSATVFIIGATNRPDLIDPALMRPGRFDKLLYVGPCTGEGSKISVLRALTRKFTTADNVDLEKVVRMCPPNITGADFYGISSTAWSSAAKRLIECIEKGEKEAKNVTQQDVIVDFEDFEVAISKFKPSVSVEDLIYFKKIKNELSSHE